LEKSPTEGDGMYPFAHYVEYAVKDIVSCFLRQNNLEDTSENRYKMETDLRTGGYYVTLAIDPEIQAIVEDTLENWNSYPSLRDPNDKIYQARNSDGSYTEIIQPQASAVVLDYRTGELKAIVGGRTKPTQRKTLNRATDMKMPVGSSIKPISVFAPAIDLGASPASVVYNMPIPIPGWTGPDGKDSWPKNFGGGGYVGPETLREALKQSHNVGAAQTLMTKVGMDRSLDYLLKLGVKRDQIDATPFGLSLGSSGITPVEMAVAFGVLGNGGVYQQPISFLGISDSNGRVVYDSHAQQDRRQVFKPSTAWLTIDMMKGAVSGGTGTRAKINGQTVAGKTGTNSDQRGVFFCGLTGWYSASVWVGHDNYKPLSSKATGSSAAAPIWQSFMKKIHDAKQLPNRGILEGDPGQYHLVKATTCLVSGQLATDACLNDVMSHGTVTDYWLEGTVPAVQCQMHKVMTICTQSRMPATEWCPPDYRANKGVVVVPNGHPLYPLLGTAYASVIAQHLGGFSQTGDGQVCPLHGYGYTEPIQQEGMDPIVQNTLIPDAQQLLQGAYAVMASMDPSTTAYQALQSAANNLEYVISTSSPSTSDVAAAMGQLTQAMAGAQ
ncbi:MAG: penicillin-binding transpeptidase domain-containing protein, partial [Clostridia bacterium]|nr:penicillin-binding transpeptidase domain-containing protein [Clostridia bacterium]